jgi:hypothetical protein
MTYKLKIINYDKDTVYELYRRSWLRYVEIACSRSPQEILDQLKEDLAEQNPTVIKGTSAIINYLLAQKESVK